jgi:membrane protein DedA with SNARE-associated domain
MSPPQFSELVVHYGYLAVFAAIFLASAGAPLPAGELLLAAAVFAAHTHHLSLPVLLLVGSIAAVAGGASGYGIGLSAGATTLERYGGRVGLSAARLRLGQYLFRIHGGKIVFVLRFIAVLGPFGGVLAGVNRMPLGRFMAFNLLGGVAWTVVFGVGGYWFGALFEAAGRTLGVAAVVLALGLIGILMLYIHRQASDLQAKADAMFAATTP